MKVNKSYVVVCTGALLLATLGGLLFTRPQQASQERQGRVRRVTAADGTPMILPSDAIPDRVSREGNITIFSVVEGYTVMDLRRNIVEAEITIEGNIKSSKARLGEEEMSIYTDFQVNVIRAVSGESPTEDIPSEMTLSIRGGKMDFPNGTAEFIDDDYPHLPEVGERYIFFLKTDPRFPGPHYLLHGSQSAFRVVAEKVLPSAVSRYPIFKTFLGMEYEIFKERIETELRALPKERRPR